MATVQFERLKSVDQKTTDLVMGFIRNAEKDLNADVIIPSLIMTTCILFYHLQELFSICGEYMNIDDESTLLQISCPDELRWQGQLARNTAYGNIKINNKYNCIYSWSIKLVKLDAFDTWIGIDSSNKKHIDSNFTSYDSNKFCAISHDGHRTLNGCDYEEPENESVSSYGYGNGMDVGDVVKMELNTMNKTMEFWVNGKSRGIAFRNILFDEIEYYFAVSLATNEPDYAHSVKLINFRQIFI